MTIYSRKEIDKILSFTLNKFKEKTSEGQDHFVPVSMQLVLSCKSNRNEILC